MSTDPLAISFEGREGSGLAQIIKTKGIAPSDVLQQEVKNRQLQRTVKARKRLENLGKAQSLWDKAEIDGWYQDHVSLQNSYATGRGRISGMLKEFGTEAFDVNTKQGFKNMLSVRGDVDKLASENKFSKQHKDYYNQVLKQYSSDPDKYDEKVLDELDEWRQMPLNKRLDARVPVLEESATDWRKFYGQKKNVDKYVNRFATAKAVETGAVETIKGTNIDRKRVNQDLQNEIQSYLFNDNASAVVEEMRDIILTDPSYARFHNDEDALIELIITPKKDLSPDMQQYGAKEEDLSLGAEYMKNFIVPKIATSYEKGLTKAPGGKVKTEDVFARLDLIDSIQKGDEVGLSALQGNIKEGRIIDINYDSDRGQITYKWKSRAGDKGEKTVDITEAGGGGFFELNNLLNEIQKTKVNEKDFKGYTQKHGEFDSPRVAPESNVDFGKVNQDVLTIMGALGERKGFVKAAIGATKELFVQPTEEKDAVAILESTPGITNVEYQRNPDLIKMRVDNRPVIIKLKGDTAHSEIQKILLDRNKEKYHSEDQTSFQFGFTKE